MINKGRQFLHHVVPGVIKPMRVLWNEIIGFLFLAIAVISIFRLVSFARTFDGEPNSLFRIGVSGFFVAMMLYFGLSSFWRARKISRS
jgi:hypothetical protein